MHALGMAVEPLGLQHAVHLVDIGKVRALHLCPALREGIRGGAAALEAWAVAGGECRHLVEEEQIRVAARAPDVMPPPLERQQTADPAPRGPAALAERLVVTMEAAAAD